ncbi:hypothetical protein Tco_0484389 [Tanacetum coccineum]
MVVLVVVKNVAVVMVVVEKIVVWYFLDSKNFGSHKEDTVVMAVVVEDTQIVIDKLVRVTFAFQKEDTVARKNLSFVNLGPRHHNHGQQRKRSRTASCNVTENYVTRDAIKRVLVGGCCYFEKEMGENNRGYDAIITKWKNSIRPKIVALSVVYDSVQRMDESWSSNLAVFQKALAEFETTYGHAFTLKACWRISKKTEMETPLLNQQHNNNEV